jgi:penicillin G amidase
MRLVRVGIAVALVWSALPAGMAAAAPPRPAGIPGLDGPVSVVRTSDGIPHIAATSTHDAFFMQGWVQAADRLFQLDYTRRAPSGTLAELLGPAALPSDVQLRTIGLRRAAERSWAAALPRSRAATLAYTAGVNAYATSHPLPPEYAALELTSFAPWTPVDTFVISKAAAFQLSFDLDIDPTVELASYLAAGAAHGFDGAALDLTDLTAFTPFSRAAVVPDATGTPVRPAADQSTSDRTVPPSTADRSAAPSTRDIAAAAALGRRYQAAIADVPMLAATTDRGRNGEHATGSNEWVIAGKHTRDGRPILANDPHLALDQPATFYPAHLRAPGLDVAGESFAGTFGVIQGQNPYLAWGSTTNPMDVTDTYLEAVRPDPTSPSGLSTVYRGRLEHVLRIPETYRANTPGDGRTDDVAAVPPSAGVPPATLVVPRRNQGPIVQLDAASGTALSVQYTGFSATQEMEAELDFDTATGLTDFQRGLRHFEVGSQNWSYADRRGNIAYFTSADLPLREDLQAGRVDGMPPYFIRDGQGGNEWLPAPHRPAEQTVPYQILPAAEMPHTVNPRAGFFVSANNDPTGATFDNDPLNQTRPGGGIRYLNPGYDGLRAGRITELLTAAFAHGGKVDRADVARMQSDTVLIDAEFFAPRIVAALDRARHSPVPALRAVAADRGLTEAVARLAHWDRSTPTGIAEGYDAADRDGRLGRPSRAEIADSVAATIYAEWRGRFIASTVDTALVPLGLGGPGGERVLVALKRALSGAPSASGIDFFANPAVADPADRRALALLTPVRTALDRLAGPDFAPAFGGSTNQDDYRWGRLHRLVLDSPLGGPFSVPTGFGAFPAPLAGLPGIPVDGGPGTVDVGNHDVRADSVNAFMFGSGPNRRYVAELTRWGPAGRSALPGGLSAVPGTRHYLDLLRPYLTDDSYAVRTTALDIARATESVAVFVPRR